MATSSGTCASRREGRVSAAAPRRQVLGAPVPCPPIIQAHPDPETAGLASSSTSRQPPSLAVLLASMAWCRRPGKEQGLRKGRKSDHLRKSASGDSGFVPGKGMPGVGAGPRDAHQAGPVKGHGWPGSTGSSQRGWEWPRGRGCPASAPRVPPVAEKDEDPHPWLRSSAPPAFLQVQLDSER